MKEGRKKWKGGSGEQKNQWRKKREREWEISSSNKEKKFIYHQSLNTTLVYFPQ